MFVQSPKSDIYVAMLAISLGAMVVGSVLLIMILQRYDFKTKVSALASPSRTYALVGNATNSLNFETVRLS